MSNKTPEPDGLVEVPASRVSEVRVKAIPKARRAIVSADRLDAVEVKITMLAADAENSGVLQGLPRGVRLRQIYFLEEVRKGRQPKELPLLEAGVILRLRRSTDGTGDTTVKLRPCPPRLPDAWLGFYRDKDHRFKLESDWAGDQRVLSASLTSTRLLEKIEPVVSGGLPVEKLFSRTQHRFLQECVNSAVDFGALSLLGPVHAGRWDDVGWCGLSLTVERWQVPGVAMDFVELSRRVDPQDAETAHRDLDRALRGQGIDPDAVGQTMKTRRVLESLCGAREGRAVPGR